ncbi:MAG: hypothetical protein OES32_07435 [Acidobacteriota bacterium]|nr:hypothetical protein [Acidobacteriota bacterium]
MLRKKGLWWTVGVAAIVLALVTLAMPTGSAADKHEPMGNHYKCYQVLDWTEYEPRKVELTDQFGQSVARVLEPRSLCNPVDKNGEGIADKASHLVCYAIQDDPQGSTERVKEVEIANQFQQGPLWVGSADMLCLPSAKSYQPRG